MERGIHLAERELYFTQRSGRSNLDGTARGTGDQAARWRQSQGRACVQKRWLEQQGSSQGRGLHCRSRVRNYLSFTLSGILFT